MAYVSNSNGVIAPDRIVNFTGYLPPSNYTCGDYSIDKNITDVRSNDAALWWCERVCIGALVNRV